MQSLAPTGGRSQTTTEIFNNCNAQLLCDDGWDLVDGGINQHRRLWLTYNFNSLTDYNGRKNYTTIVALLSVMTNVQNESKLVFGFDWKHTETLSRLLFDTTDASLERTVFSDNSWHSLHEVTCRSTA